MKPSQRFICFLLFSIIGCLKADAQYFYYSPVPQYCSAFIQKSDFTAGIGISRGAGSGMVLSFARAMTSRFLLSSSYATLGLGSIRKANAEGTQYRRLDLALGAYEGSSQGVISILIGGAYGDLFGRYDLGRVAKFKMGGYYVQPGLMFLEKYAQFGLSIRMFRLHYLRGDVDYAIPEEYVTAIRGIENNGPFFLPEMGASAGIRLDNLTLSLYVSSGFSDVSQLNLSRFNASFMLLYDFRRKTNK